MKRKSEIFKTSLLNLIKAFFKWFIKNVGYINLSLFVLFCLGISEAKMEVYNKNLLILVLGVILLLGQRVIDEFEKEKHKLNNNIPVLDKRFTKLEDDRIVVNKDEFSEMVLYLYSIENYLQKIGFYD